MPILPASAFVGYLVSAMLAWSPWHVGETREQTRLRYEAIAEDAADEALARHPDDEEPWVRAFPSPDVSHPVTTSLLMLAIASYESGGFRRDIDNVEATGDCTGGTCHARCLAQVRLRAGETMASRRDCFRLELDRMRESYVSCGVRPWAEGLAVYASGRCDRGTQASRRRFARALDWWTSAPFLLPFDDA